MFSAPDKYLDVLREIKRRTTVIDSFMAGKTHAVFEATNLETVFEKLTGSHSNQRDLNLRIA